MFARQIIQYKWLIIGIVLLLVAGSVLVLPRLKVDVGFSTFFPKGDPQLTFYEDFTSKMGSTDPFIFLPIKPSADKVFDQQFLTRIDAFAEDCQQIPAIKKVSSITNSNRFYNTPFGIISSPYLRLDNAETLKEDSLRIVKDAYLTKRFFSEGNQFLFVILELEEDLDLKLADSTLTEVDSLITTYNFKEFHLLGRKYMEVHYKRIVTKELGKSLLLSMVFIMLVLGFLYRSVSGILMPLLSMFFALLLLYGFLAFTGRSLGILANLFPTIMLIVGISDIIHIFTKYNFEIQNGLDKTQAVSLTIKEIGLTTFYTSLTTAVGFLTLATSSMTAIRDFGLDAAIGVMIAYAVSILFVPAVLLATGMQTPVRSAFFSKKWNSFSEKLIRLVDHKPGMILGTTLMILGLSLVGILNVNTNNLLLTNIPNQHRLKSDFQVFEKELGGGRSFEMAISCSKENGFDLDCLENIRALHLYLENRPEIDRVFSPITYYYGISKIFEPGLALFDLPDSDSRLRQYVRRADNALSDSSWKLVDSTQTLGRISARMKDLGRQKVKTLNTDISNWIQENLDTNHLQFNFTGTDMLIDRGHQLRIQNMGQGLVIAILTVALLMGLIFRSFTIIAITLIVNIFPLLFLAGVMGYTGIELRGTSSIIFTIAFVIAVDDTIHFMSKFKIERQKGLSIREAVQKTIKETLKAIVLTSIILFGGFFVLVHSNFWDVYVHGILVSAILLFALMVDLFLLPVLILKFLKDDS